MRDADQPQVSDITTGLADGHVLEAERLGMSPLSSYHACTLITTRSAAEITEARYAHTAAAVAP